MLKIESDGGKGRAFVLVYEHGVYAEAAKHLSSVLSQKTRVLLLSSQAITEANWNEGSSELRELLKSNAIRQASFVGFGAACALVQNIGLQELKSVRTLVLVDGTSRPHPTQRDRILDRIEALLPLGLPLRSQSVGFDARPFLQRIRCPVLVVTTRHASPYQLAQAQIMSDHLPTSWQVGLTANANLDAEARELSDLVLSFQEVPAKCPQGGRGAAA